MSVFQNGDVVFHIRFGRGIVNGGADVGSRDYIYVIYDENGMLKSHQDYISYTPWEKACHERPLKPGWWVVQFVDDTYGCKWRTSELTYTNHPGSSVVFNTNSSYSKFICEVKELNS